MAADVSPSKEDARKAGVFYEDDYFDSDEEEDGDAGAADAMDQGTCFFYLFKSARCLPKRIIRWKAGEKAKEKGARAVQ